MIQKIKSTHTYKEIHKRYIHSLLFSVFGLIICPVFALTVLFNGGDEIFFIGGVTGGLICLGLTIQYILFLVKPELSTNIRRFAFQKDVLYYLK